ncbi:hypothetical protein ACRDNQ_03975 [Palleronia sp. KMU-117]|uniref:hypothetical protein n=1 Tax=Palleronia sp. KMU-117 TaxID=3434108 RepID=UPI003D7286AC
MDTITLTASITYPVADIEAFADARGYQSVVPNPAFSSTIDPVTMEETTNGEERTISNPQTRLDFVKAWFKEQAVELFAQDLKRTAEREARRMADEIAAQRKEQIAAAITIQ